MNRNDFKRLAADKIVIFDGATGTELAKQGMPPGVCPEAWIVEHPDAIINVQRAYRDAGSDIVYVPSFGANPAKLAEFGFENRVVDLNIALAALSRQAVPDGIIFGDLAPTGKLIEPCGELEFEECVRIFKTQAQALISGGVDGFVIETMMDLQEARAALIAVRELSSELPVIVTMTFEPGGRTLTGNSPLSALLALQGLGADAFGCNCSTGPGEMAAIIRMLKPYAAIPLVAKPNAGLPRLRDGKTCFELEAEPFGPAAAELADAGAALLGGCCGTTPKHIASLRRALGERRPLPVGNGCPGMISSPAGYRRIAAGTPFTLIGERINPTGKKAFQQELREGRVDMAIDFAYSQLEAGASVIDVNCGLGGIDEPALLKKLVMELAMTLPGLPLCIDSTNPEAVEAALRVYPGRALLNSISLERERIEKILPIAVKYGAMPILLPLSDDGIPESSGARIEALDKLLDAWRAVGGSEHDCVVDALVMTVSADPAAAVAALDFIDDCSRRRGLATVCGLSNVSFGLPNRPAVNAAFLGLAIGRGLDSAIANPAAAGIRETVIAADALLGKDRELEHLLVAFSDFKPGAATAAAASASDPRERLRAAIIDGERENATATVKELLAAGANPGALVNEVLIPALTEVGDKFERKEFFLPQLMRSANAMRHAMNVLEPELARLRDSSAVTDSASPVFLLATVQGDIHDIGKNIVALLLRNHNFEVIDLGKDVAPETILDAAVKYHADLIGLSALMTTTMPEMKKTIELLRANGIQVPVFVGGAAVDPHYAAEIGAIYGGDAMATVREALRVMEKKNEC